MPKVSVIIPSYNRADMVMDAVNSVLNQTFTDWELIIIDDGSNDNTQEVISRVSDHRVHYFYQENKGLPGARNAGIHKAVGKYVAFLDSDDLFLPNKLASQVRVLDENKHLSLVAGGYIEVDKNLNVLRQNQPWKKHPSLELKDWVLNCPFCPAVPLVKRNCLEEANLFDEKMPYIEDWDLWLRMSNLGCQMDWLNEFVCMYRIHGGNMVRQAQRMKQGMVTMLDKLYSSTSLPQEILALKNCSYANIYLNATARSLAAGDEAEGKACLAAAIKYDPQLLEGNPPRYLDILAAFTLSPICPDANVFMQRLMNNLPDGMAPYPQYKINGLLNAIRAYDAYGNGNPDATIRSFFATITNDPGWLFNRGLLSIAGQSIIKRISQK